MIEVIRYNPEHKSQWDNFLQNSRNGTFLLFRNYMDYHSDRFNDCSFIAFKQKKVLGLIPGNIDNTTFFSHQGLTYGGLISSVKTKTQDTIEIFNQLDSKLADLGVEEVIYKPIPLIYHNVPSQEDIYALFLRKAEKIGCHISSTIYQRAKISFNESRKSGLRKSIREGIEVVESDDIYKFWEILENNLSNKYGAKPVHSLEEIELLKSRFPNEIKLYLAEHHGTAVAGTIIYLMNNLVHIQYISASELGKETGALDKLFDILINKEYAHIPIFDFGTSTVKMGRYLNDNLIFQKEGFGGRGIVYEIYKYKLI